MDAICDFYKKDTKDQDQIMRSKSIKINAIYNIIYKLSSLIFPLLVYPYVSRILLPERLGIVSFFSNMTNYSITIASLGIAMYGVRAISKVRDSKEETGKVARDLIILNSIVTLFVIVILGTSFLFVGKFQQEPFIFFVNLMQIAMIPLNVEWIFNGIEEYGFIAKRAVVVRFLTLIGIFAFVKVSGDYRKYALITIIGFISNYICNFLFSFRYITYPCKGKPDFKRHIKPMLILFASVVAINIYTHVDSVRLGFIDGDRAVGLYDIACKAKLVLLSLINAISGVLFPRLSYYISTGDQETYNYTLRKSISSILLIAIPMSAAFVIEARDVVLILGGGEYIDSTLCMQILMPILIISGFSNITGNQILLPRGMDLSYMLAVIVGAIVDVIMNLILMPQYSLYGAAVATLFAEIVQMSIQLYCSRKYLKGNIEYIEIVKILFSAIIAALIMYIVSKMVVNLPTFIHLMISFGSFLIIYIVTLFLLKNKTLKTLISR